MASTASDILKAFNHRAKLAGWGFVCGPAQGFEHAGLTAMDTLWREKAQGRPMPNRADLTARAMKPYLSQMSLLERVVLAGKARYRVRLHGSVLASYTGDGTGKFIDDVVTPERADGFTALYDTVLQVQAPVRVITYYQMPQINYLIGESFVAPLAVPSAETPILLSVTYAKPRLDAAGVPQQDASRKHA